MTDTNVVTTHQNKPPIVVLRERLEQREVELKSALTDVDPKHFIRAVITAAQINPDLQACSFQSLWLACMKACRDNLMPDGREGAIVAFKSNAQWIPMYQGLLKRFRQSGMAKWITADVVREGETFEHWVDQNGEHFKHVPGDENTPIIKVYAAALTTDGAFYVAVMSIADINKIKAQSRASRDDSPWKVWPEEMMKKTALRRLSKMLPAGRDFFTDDDEDMVNKLPEPGPQIQIVQREAGAASALDQFAGGQTEGGEVEHTAEGPTGEPTGETGEQGHGVRPEAVRRGDPISSGLTDPISIAYGRGKVAKQTGSQRRAMPGEYREEGNKAEADAWLAGFDGKEMPNAEATG